MKKMVMKMSNKVLIKVEFVKYNVIFEVFIPVDELIWKVAKLIEKSAADLLGVNDSQKNYVLINKITNQVYDVNNTVKESDIRNGTELVFY